MVKGKEGISKSMQSLLSDRKSVFTDTHFVDLDCKSFLRFKSAKVPSIFNNRTIVLIEGTSHNINPGEPIV